MRGCMYDNIEMFKHLLSILLVIGIVACPLLCGRGVGCCGAERACDVHACCAACHQAESDGGGDRNSAPSGHQSGSEQCNGCICGGAVIEVSTSQYLVDAASIAIVSPTAVRLVDATSVLHQSLNRRASLPDDDMNPGRALRCQMSSYLC
jgi:hypothetical protein